MRKMCSFNSGVDKEYSRDADDDVDIYMSRVLFVDTEIRLNIFCSSGSTFLYSPVIYIANIQLNINFAFGL